MIMKLNDIKEGTKINGNDYIKEITNSKSFENEIENNLLDGLPKYDNFKTLRFVC